MQHSSVIGKTLHRDIKFKRDAIDQENRTVELAFSSEEPVERYFGMEILSHASGAIRLDRLKDGGPVLMDHDTSDVVGVIESVSVGNDRIGRAVVRFGKSARASEIFQDVVDGIRSKVSVGYLVHAMELDSKDNGGETYRITDWEPLEISIVSVPADATVGVGRSAERPQQQQLETNQTRKDNNPMNTTATTTDNPAAAPAVNVEAVRTETRNAELKRIQDINAIAKQHERHGAVAIAQDFISSGKSPDEFRTALLEAIGKTPVPSADIGLTEREVQGYSFVRAIAAMINPNDPRAQKAAGFELEVSRAAAEKSNKEVRGILIPAEVLAASFGKRDLTKGTSTAGGHTVATDLLGSSFIDILRKRAVVQQLGATLMTGLVGNVAIPRQTGAATAYWVAESGAPTESQQAFDQVTLSPKTVGAYTDYSRKLFLQSSLDIESFVRNDLARVIALEIDRAALYGSGSSNQPLGIKDTTNVNTVDFAADAPTWAEVVDLESQIAADNADIGALKYLISAAGRGALKTAKKDSGSGIFIIEDNKINGYGFEVSNQVASGDYWFGNWSDLMIGMWSGLDLMVDPITGATSGTVRIVALQDMDSAVRHPESFCRGNNTL
ncbi:MAG: phage major capsid protein [Alphaproteobacteria bacterium]|nr:phage major capsid protein [Alphaproteobacteria bacterium]